MVKKASTGGIQKASGAYYWQDDYRLRLALPPASACRGAIFAYNGGKGYATGLAGLAGLG